MERILDERRVVFYSGASSHFPTKYMWSCFTYDPQERRTGHEARVADCQGERRRESAGQRLRGPQELSEPLLGDAINSLLLTSV